MRPTLTPTSTPTPARLLSARIAVALTFFVNGAVQANWVARIPAVQSRLEATNGQLGVVLLGLPLGLFLAALPAGWLIGRYGSRAVARAGGFIVCLTLPLLAIVPDVWLLLPALGLYGAAGAALDVGMNTQAAAVEAGYGRPIMASLHGFFSLGGLIGAAIGGLVASRGVRVLPHFLVAGALLGILILVAGQWLLPEAEAAGKSGAPDNRGEQKRGPLFARPSGTLIGLGVVALCGLLGEGAIADWSAIYLRRRVGTGAGLAPAGFAAFSLAMAAGRLLGDRATKRLGPKRLVRLGGLLGALGMLLVIAVPRPVAAIAGFGCVGLGFSIIFPLVIAAAGRSGRGTRDEQSAPSTSRTGSTPGAAIAAVTTAGYVGLLAGPPLIGLTAQATTLRAALGIVAALSLVVALLASSVGDHSRAEQLS